MGIEWAVMAATLSSMAQTGMALDKPKAPREVKPPEPPADMGKEGALRAEREGEMRRRRQGSGGRASTILSGSPLGVPGQANTGRKLLTGY
jgi:hypothetical protein